MADDHIQPRFLIEALGLSYIVAGELSLSRPLGREDYLLRLCGKAQQQA